MNLWSEIVDLPVDKIKNKYFGVKADGKKFYSKHLFYVDLISFQFDANEKGEMADDLLDAVVTCRQTKNSMRIFVEIPFDAKKIAYDTMINNAFLAEFDIAITPPKSDSNKDWEKYYKVIDKFSKSHARISNFQHAVWPITSVIRHLFRSAITKTPPSELVVGETVDVAELFTHIYDGANVLDERYQEITEIVRVNVYDAIGGEGNFVKMAQDTVRAIQQQQRQQK